MRCVPAALMLAMLCTCAGAGEDLITARRLVAAGQYREAEKILRVLVRDPMTAPEANYLTYRCLMGRGEPERALLKLQMAVESAPDRADWRVELADLLATRDAVEEAMMQYVGALATNPAFVPAHLGLARALTMKGLYREAEAQLREATRLAPGSEEVWVLLCETILRSGRPLEALRTTSEVAARFPNNLRLVHVLAQAYEQLGENAKAIEAYGRVTAANPKDAVAWMSLGRLYQLKQMHQRAVAAYSRAATLLPKDPLPLLGIARSQLEMPRGAGQALRYADRALALAPGNQTAAALKGWALWLLQRQKQAVAVLTKAATDSPGSAEAMYYLGLIAKSQGNLQEAVSWLRKAIAEGAGTPVARNAREALSQLSGEGSVSAQPGRVTISPTEN